MNASGLDLNWIWTGFGLDLDSNPPNGGGLKKDSD